ncbi:MAG: hypothetical protein COV99_04705 [Bacteroidetes bacterium CG12_big_fil_rev_8_21_14_0_65_60_17]|nr:MAG: hypothetical protein COV99_04705 [Bacteroidetes bacterium CG12_big_fil_rev_8_21_14_0_65_60_17]
MKNLFTLTLALFLTASASFAQSNKATHSVSVNVSEISVISVSGDVSMTISAATAGQAPDPVTASSSYAVTTNGQDKKITGELDTDMPEGLTLNASMAAPEGADSAGKKALSKSAVDLVSNIDQVRGQGLALTYEAVATVNANPDGYTRTVTYTITNN